jgi:hypothetical protein
MHALTAWDLTFQVSLGYTFTPATLHYMACSEDRGKVYLKRLWCKNGFAETALLNKGSCLARALGVTKLKNIREMILVILCCAT